MIPFNKPYLSGNELNYIRDTVKSGSTSGNNKYTKKVHNFFSSNFQFNKCLLTTSCTDALEMSAILLNVSKGDEIILPSYTFVSTANAFMLRGAQLRFVDSTFVNPNIDVEKIEELITEKTKAIVIVHYAGIACDMEKVISIARKHGIFIIEDAAQAINSKYKDRFLGSIGDFGTFSFHETKNIICGEGGMLCVNNLKFKDRSEIIWEKGTNRSAFFRGDVDKYGWVDIGSSFLISDILAAFLFGQLENLHQIQEKRITLWKNYYKEFEVLSKKYGVQRPHIPNYATNNGHLFYLVCNSLSERTALIEHLRSLNIHAVFHYLSLHSSTYFKDKYRGPELTNCDRYSNCLLRLPLYFELKEKDQYYIIKQVKNFYQKLYG